MKIKKKVITPILAVVAVGAGVVGVSYANDTTMGTMQRNYPGHRAYGNS